MYIYAYVDINIQLHYNRLLTKPSYVHAYMHACADIHLSIGKSLDLNTCTDIY